MATYYIAASGSTSNSGTSPSAPWPLSKVASATFVAGDNILFNKGDTFTGTTSFSKSGSSGNPITFDCYGTAVHNPVLDGNGSSAAPVLNLTGSYITINNLVVQNCANPNGNIRVNSGCHDITIYNCYINTGIRGINLTNAGSGGVANLRILHGWFTNIMDNDSHTNGGGSHIQFNNCNGAGMEVAYGNHYTDMSNDTLGVGDQISIYQTNGTAASYVLVHDNNIVGGSTHLDGYDGIGVGDVGGSYQYAYNNKCVNPGCAGIQLVGGTNIIVDSNKIYSDYNPSGFQGITCGFFGGTPAGNWTCTNNKINFTNKYNNKSAWYVATTAGTPAVDMSTNTPMLSFDPSITSALLPNPLWPAGTSPWDTLTSLVSVTGRKMVQFIMALVDDIVLVAKSYVGQEEIRENQGFKSPSFESQMKNVGWYKGAPWCAFLAKLIWQEAFSKDDAVGLALLHKYMTGSALGTYHNFAASKEFHVTHTPGVGDVVIWQEGVSATVGHAGVVISVDGTTLQTVEGNTNTDGSREGYIAAIKTRHTGLAHSATGLNLVGFVQPIRIA